MQSATTEEKMAIERIRFANLDRWGNLVKTWATGVNKLGDGNQYPVPKTFAEFKAQLVMANVGATVPSYIASVSFIQNEKETFLVRLPAKELVEDSESTLSTGGAYDVPSFYATDVFKTAQPSILPADKLRVHAMRIGDYTMGNCL
jgi:hypothetical protein